MRELGVIALVVVVAAANGCSTAKHHSAGRLNSAAKELPRDFDSTNVEASPRTAEHEAAESNGRLQRVHHEAESRDNPVEAAGERQSFRDDEKKDGSGWRPRAEKKPSTPADDADSNGQSIRLRDVIASVHASYPLLEAALLDSAVASGNQLAAWGEFDTQLEAASQNGPAGFYQTYRQTAGVTQPIYRGGKVFGGYRIGRGDFEPWYLERQTNDGGEFEAGVRIPLLKDRAIDARRAELWRTTYDRQRVRPEIRAQLIWFVRDATVAYWVWIAAGQQYEIGRQALRLSQERNARLQRRVEEGDLDPPVLQDNLRSIAERESKLIDRGRKVQQAAVKLSLFYRADDGAPIVPEQAQLSAFPDPTQVLDSQLDGDIQRALAQRPELAALDALSRRINVDLAEAQNGFLPSVDVQVSGSQDLGQQTTRKRDKSRLELEAGLFVDVPMQRRKARGKSLAAQAKLSQVAVKRRFTQDRIVAQVRSAYAALTAARDRVGKSREARRLAEYMAGVERRKFELGQTDLLSVFLREQSAIEAADGEVEALLEYFVAQADYAAALALDWPAGLDKRR